VAAVLPLLVADPDDALHDDDASVETLDDVPDDFDVCAVVPVAEAVVVGVLAVPVPAAMHAPRTAVATTLAAPAAALERAAGRRRRRVGGW